MIPWHSFVSCEKLLELQAPVPDIQGSCPWCPRWGSSVASNPLWAVTTGSIHSPAFLTPGLICPS